MNTSATNSESIAAVRALFEAELATPERAQLYHQVDIARVRTEEWQVKRFLLDNDNDTQKAFSKLCAALQWKKEFGLHDLTETSFPLQLWQMINAEMCGRDRSGHILNWNILKRYIKFKNPAARRLTQQFLAFNNERCDRAAGEEGFVIITDTTGAGISNICMEDVQFMINFLGHYPLGMNASYIVNLPWILSSIVKMILTLMPAKLRETFKFISIDELHQLVEEKYIPVAMKGTREKVIYPSGLKNVEECYEQMGMDQKVVDTFRKMVVD